MVLGHSHRRHSLASNRSSMEDNNQDDETVIDDDQGNVLSHLISQLRPGADLSRVTFPTFILEPRSMLERITNFMAHPETLLPMPEIDDPVQRFVAVTKFYLSGWHIKPPGVKKPLNPILGETFTGYWDYSDGTRGYYISEQTSHHPPKSSYFFMAPEHHIRIDGTLKPRSKFLGNSAASLMEGIAVMRFTNRNERYFITQPNMYARGILFGKMKYELGDHAQVKCPETGLEVDIEFKVKGWVGGTYNAIGGYIKDSRGKALFELSGFWNGDMHIKDLTTGKKQLLFDATHAKPTIPRSRPIEEQAERESQRLWAKVNAAVKKADHRAATDEKTVIEDRQREEAVQRGDLEWRPKLFRKALGAAGKGGPGDEPGEENLDWVIDATVDAPTPQALTEQILAIAPILPGQHNDTLQQPPYPPSLEKSPNPAAATSGQDTPQQTQTPEKVAGAGHKQNDSHHRNDLDGTSSAPNTDLIDFGAAEPVKQGLPVRGRGESREGLGTQGQAQGNGGRPGMAFSMEPLQPKVLRADSVDGGSEEFVDAEM
ncbi:putative oxysterol-binding protein 2 [Elsinoe australis]|uniref:Putative oxysterol-binding protein 2 n=1 Tax=Elsinoe australis TaxID=40998 RepID=A0A4U7AXA1_9PEZI|nr:putative oxysterol-binding protein 2 [Elsinoe australis]